MFKRCFFVTAVLFLCSVSFAEKPAANRKPTPAGPLKNAPASDADIKNLVFAGDSITVGFGCSDREYDRYPAVTTRLLREKFPNVVEINKGKSGQALCSQGQGYPDEILSLNPDAVVIQWGVNDQYWGFSVTQFAACYEQLVQILRESKPEMPIVLTTLVADFRWPENYDLWIGEANIAIQEIAVRYNCRMAYIHKAFDHNRRLYADTIHPNAAGAKVMAREVVAAFNSPAASKDKLILKFDQGRQVRFMQYVFDSKREGDDPKWVCVSDLCLSHIRIETEQPISVRTAPIYKIGESYLVKIFDKNGNVIDSLQVKIAYDRTISFTITPKVWAGPYNVEITQVKMQTKPE